MKQIFRVRFVRDVAVTGGAQVGYAVATMIGGIIVARVLGPSGRGTLSVLTALGALAVLLAVFGDHLLPLVVLRVASELLIATLLFVAIRRIRSFSFTPSMGLFRRQVRYGLRNYASSLLWAFLLQSDVILCNHFLGKSE